jgi:hypothetical protein
VKAHREPSGTMVKERAEAIEIGMPGTDILMPGVALGLT